MFTNEIEKYQSLNKLSEQNGIVIFGGTSDKKIPLCELKQAFDLRNNLYNRSFEKLSVKNACEIYDDCLKTLYPETLLLHIGESDLDCFKNSPSNFVSKYRELIKCIRNSNPKCHIAIISLKNPNGNHIITELNKQLKYIAESEQCEYEDISLKRIWNPRQTKDIISFVYSTGFVHPLNKRRSVYDLTKILFCFDPSYII